jgi:hypothetical protein
MRTYLRIGIIATSALVVVSPMAAANAATTHVLTIGKTGGTAVKAGAVLKTGLVRGTAAVFSLGGEKLTCKVSTIKAKVTSNPAKPGKAKESVTSLGVSKCSTNIGSVTVKSVVVNNLPYKVTVSDSKGDPVTVSGRSKSKPVQTTVTASLGTTTVVCSYRAKVLKGKASNKGNLISFTKQKFTKSAGGAFCPAGAFFTGKFGPVRDFSVKGHPKVFVN